MLGGKMPMGNRVQGRAALGGTGGPELLFSWVPWEQAEHSTVQGPEKPKRKKALFAR